MELSDKIVFVNLNSLSIISRKLVFSSFPFLHLSAFKYLYVKNIFVELKKETILFLKFQQN